MVKVGLNSKKIVEIYTNQTKNYSKIWNLEEAEVYAVSNFRSNFASRSTIPTRCSFLQTLSVDTRI